MFLLTILFSLLYLPVFVFAAWGYTDDGSNYVIDNGANLVIKVSKCCGDIMSMKYKGQEMSGYSGAPSGKYTHVESGLGASTVSIQALTAGVAVFKITVINGTMKHYIIVRYKNDNVYILTNKGSDTPRAQRYIVRFPGSIFSYSDNDTDFYPSSCTSIEASGDVCAMSDGRTFSKHYSSKQYGRVMDYDYVGRSKSGLGLFMVRSNHEKASGGPFFRSLLRRGDPAGEDLYDIYYYNMGHTDPERYGLQGPSVIVFTDGSTPSSALFARNANWDWMDGLDLSGWVPASGRGYAAGVGIKTMKANIPYVVGLKNSAAQYWTTAASSGGAWRIDKVIPGTYTLNVYKNELEVYTGSVTVTAGQGVAVNTITVADPTDTTAIWRIGEWDGTPEGFVNFESKPYPATYMHPSDKRLKAWDQANFIIGTTAVSSFPSYMWVDVNNGHLIYFKLTSAQLATGHTVRIGITEAYINGRPQISLNGKWTSPIPAATTQASTRSLTVGTYRGNNVMLKYDVPASAWVQSTSEYQVLKIDVVSGSSGSGFLSAGIAIDAVDLI